MTATGTSPGASALSEVPPAWAATGTHVTGPANGPCRTVLEALGELSVVGGFPFAWCTPIEVAPGDGDDLLSHKE